MVDFDAARQKVSLPGTLLMLVGAIALLSSCVMVGWSAVNLSTLIQADATEPSVLAPAVGYVLGGLLSLLVPLLQVFAGMRIRDLRSAGFVKVVAILGMIPCCVSCPCLIGTVPVGIWALVVLRDPMVKEAMEEVARIG